MDATVGDSLSVDCVSFPIFRGKRWTVHVWEETRDEWQAVSRYGKLAKIAHRTDTVLAREMGSRQCPMLGREVELQQLRRGIQDVVTWEAIDLRVVTPTTVGEVFTIVSWDAVSIGVHRLCKTLITARFLGRCQTHCVCRHPHRRAPSHLHRLPQARRSLRH